MTCLVDLPSFADPEEQDQALQQWALEELRERGARLEAVFFMTGFIEPHVLFMAQRSEGLAASVVHFLLPAEEVCRDGQAAWLRAIDHLESELRRRFPSERDLAAPLV